ncbi:MAG: SIS domain-containing protein [Dehalococcoidia bacterium]|jgi:D-sedoheptulose 7-phosphate isomerase
MKPIYLQDRRAKRRQTAGGMAGSPPRPELIRLLDSYARSLSEALRALPIREVARVAEEMIRARAEDKTVYVLGNGGSAATASHAVTDWHKPNHDDSRGGVKAVSLTDNVALLTAWANDTSFEDAFANQLQSSLVAGDVVIAVSGSGNSPNVLRAIEAARRCGAVTIGFSGFQGGALAGLVDISVVVSADQQGLIEDVHMALVHALTVALRQTAAATDEGEANESAAEASAI